MSSRRQSSPENVIPHQGPNLKSRPKSLSLAIKNQLKLVAPLGSLNYNFSTQYDGKTPTYKSEQVQDPLDIANFLNAAPILPDDDNPFDGIFASKMSNLSTSTLKRKNSYGDKSAEIVTSPTEAYLERHQSALPDFCESIKFEWKDLNVFVGDEKKGTQILFNSNGCIESGQLLAVMGGSGAGKSTLLNALSGRTNLNQQTVKGYMSINGNKFKCSHQKIIKALCTYVPQSDILCPTQTVEEALLFYAKLKLPHLSAEKQKKRINYLIHVLHLDKCRHNFIGSESKRGISGGEKRRVSIASEILNDADIIFLDEPTSGLDAYTAARTIKTLKQFCFVSNKIIISTIHQPSIEVFYLFDKLFLLANGRCCFNSKMSDIDIFFEQSLRPKTNPADVIIFEAQRHPVEWAEEWEDSKLNPYGTKAVDVGSEFDKYPTFHDEIGHKKAGVCLEYALLLQREIMAIWRDKRVSIMRLAQVLFFALVCGTLYQNLIDSFNKKMQCHFLMGVIPILFGMVSCLVTFPAQKLLFQREYNSDTYSIFTWSLSFIIIEIPRELVHMVIFTAIAYNMTGLDGSFTDYFFTLFLTAFAGGSFGLFFGTITRTTVEAAQTVPVAFIPLLIFADVIVPLGTLPDFAIYLARVDPLYYIERCFYLIEFTGVEYSAELMQDERDLCNYCRGLETAAFEQQSAMERGPLPFATPGPTPSSELDEVCAETITGRYFLKRKDIPEDALIPYWIYIIVICLVLRMIAIFILWITQNNGFSWLSKKIGKCFKCECRSSSHKEGAISTVASNTGDTEEMNEIEKHVSSSNVMNGVEFAEINFEEKKNQMEKTRGLASIRRLRRQTVAESNLYTGKALFAFTGGYRQYELTFHPGTKLVVTIDEEDNQGWVFGHYAMAPDLDGWFPKSYIEIINAGNRLGKSPSPGSPGSNTLRAIIEENGHNAGAMSLDVISKMDTDITINTQESFDI